MKSSDGTLLDSHSEMNARGTTCMGRLSAVVCCMVRDAESGLRSNIPRIERLLELFGTARVVVIENDSVDATKSILAQWAKRNFKVKIISKDTGVETIPPASRNSSVARFFSEYRMSRMASFRNQYMDEIERGERPDVVLVLDADVESFSLDGVRHSFGLPLEWDAVVANGLSTKLWGKNKRVYYDTYALREHGVTDPVTHVSLAAGYLKWALDPKAESLPVDSGFGGMGIYRYESIAGLRYRVIPNVGGDPDIEALCEHESLYADMRARGFGRIFMNPALVVVRKSWWGRKKRRFSGIVSKARILLTRNPQKQA